VIETFATLLAQQPARPQQPGFDPVFVVGLPLIIIVFYVIVLSGSRKQKKQRAVMLSNVKKNDRVMTIGGVLGTVTNIKENEITLKVDETNNVKITVIRAAIQKVLAEGEAPTEIS
jgi:preprotein translocase subunit YajC